MRVRASIAVAIRLQKELPAVDQDTSVVGWHGTAHPHPAPSLWQRPSLRLALGHSDEWAVADSLVIWVFVFREWVRTITPSAGWTFKAFTFRA